MSVTKDMKVLDDLYRSQKNVINKNEKKKQFYLDDAMAAKESEKLMGDFATAFEIVARHNDEEKKTGADRDVSEIAQGMRIFGRLLAMLETSGRSEDSKHMSPVSGALRAYMQEDGIKYSVNGLKEANNLPDETKEEGKKKAIDDAFNDITAAVELKMDNFIQAADKYIEDHEGWTKAWTEAGKQRRTLVRVARIQMEDQKKQFAINKDKIRDDISNSLEAALAASQDEISLSAHKAVDQSLKEAVEKRDKDIIDQKAKDIARQIEFEDKLSGENKEQAEKDMRDASAVGDLLNFGRTTKAVEKFDVTRLYTEYMSLKDNKYAKLTTSRESLLAYKRYTVKSVKDDSEELKSQKAAIFSMFYLMTGSLDEPPFIYLWEKPEQGYGFGDKNVAQFKKAYPLAVPTFNKEGSATGEEFVNKAKSLYGDKCLDEINYMKFVQGTALKGTKLLDAGDKVWKDITRVLARKGPKEELTPEDLALGTVIQTRYLGIMKALNDKDGQLPEGVAANKDIPLPEPPVPEPEPVEEPINET